MGLFSDVKAIKDVQKIKNGTEAELSLNQVVNLLVNLPDAKKNLSADQFKKVCKIYDELRKQTTKHLLDLDGYYDMATNIILLFDKVAPYEKYSGGNAMEFKLLMDKLRNSTGIPTETSINSNLKGKSFRHPMTVLDALLLVGEYTNVCASGNAFGPIGVCVYDIVSLDEYWKDDLIDACKLYLAQHILFDENAETEIEALTASLIGFGNFLTKKDVKDIQSIMDGNTPENFDYTKLTNPSPSYRTGELNSYIQTMKLYRGTEFVKHLDNEGRNDAGLWKAVSFYAKYAYEKADVQMPPYYNLYFWPLEDLSCWLKEGRSVNELERYRNLLETI